MNRARCSLNDLVPGDHVCAVHETDVEQQNVLVAYVRSGLDRRERVQCIVPDCAAVAAILSGAGIDVDGTSQSGQLSLLDCRTALLPHGSFDPSAYVDAIRREGDISVEKGWSALRVAIDMSWALDGHPGADRVIEYSDQVGKAVADLPLICLCSYDRRRFPPSLLLALFRTHALAVVGDELFDNPYFVPSDDARREEPERTLDRWTRLLKERRALVDSLRTSERRYRLLFDSLINAYALHEMITDADGKPLDYRFLEVNPAFERLSGISSEGLVGRTVREVMPDIDHVWIQAYGRVVETGEPVTLTDFAASLGKHYEVVAFRPEPGQFAVLFHDVTDRVEAERERERLARQAFESQKLESLGVLAGGIAHDFNNLLVGILGNASLALEDLPPEHPVTACLKDIEVAAQRAAGLSRQLLAYSGRGRFVVEPTDLSALIEEMGHLLEASVQKSISLRYLFERDLKSVMADASQLRQLVMNLVLNAAQAIGEKSGIITISTSMMECDERYLAGTVGAADLMEGPYVFLEVSDTGCGMTADIKDKMFEPFFSTKREGRGLGLSAVLGIVRAHGGAMRVYSEVDRGTTFKILLPTCEDVARQKGRRPDSKPTWKASGTILVVDDEPSVRQFARRCLQRWGFDVLSAEDGREALAIYERHRDIIKVVLLDMMMPHMGGEKTFTELRRIDPNVRVVLSSGYNEQDAVQRFAGRGLAGFIQKPYQVQKLLEVIRGIVDSE